MEVTFIIIFSSQFCIQTLSNRECMLCVLTAFEILSGQGRCIVCELYALI